MLRKLALSAILVGLGIIASNFVPEGFFQYASVTTLGTALFCLWVPS